MSNRTVLIIAIAILVVGIARTPHHDNVSARGATPVVNSESVELIGKDNGYVQIYRKNKVAHPEWSEKLIEAATEREEMNQTKWTIGAVIIFFVVFTFTNLF